MIGENIIEIEHTIELIKCKVCGNITDPIGDIVFRTEINVCGNLLDVSMQRAQTNYIESACLECHKIFKSHTESLEKALNEREGKYNYEITIKDLRDEK